MMSIDISTITHDNAGQFVHLIAADPNPVLVYMPNHDYKGMQAAENLAEAMGVKILIIPITVVVMDLVKQMEFAGVEITERLLRDIPVAIRVAIMESLNLKEM